MNKPITEEQKETIRRMYPKHFASDIAPVIGADRSVVTRYAKVLGVSHDPKWYKKAISERNKVSANQPGKGKAISARLRNMYDKERRRLLNGEKQKTRCRVRILPQRIILRMDYMVRQYKYFRGSNPNACVLYYDSQTKRSERVEKTSFNDYGITFEQGDE